MRHGQSQSGNIVTLRDIPVEFDPDGLSEYLRIRPDTEDACQFTLLLERARAVARPKAVFKESYVEDRGCDNVTIDGINFKSAALRKNLDKVERVFPYVATCGAEFDLLGEVAADPMKQFWLDTLKETALRLSTDRLNEHLTMEYRLDRTATMSPGSADAEVWPIEQQRQLFSLFGDVKELIGVELTESCLMVPLKSVSGIVFPTEIGFQSCQLCHRENCRLRAAPFDKDMWDSIHGAQAKEETT
jgi:hypothetical protein